MEWKVDHSNFKQLTWILISEHLAPKTLHIPCHIHFPPYCREVHIQGRAFCFDSSLHNGIGMPLSEARLTLATVAIERDHLLNQVLGGSYWPILQWPILVSKVYFLLSSLSRQEWEGKFVHFRYSNLVARPDEPVQVVMECVAGTAEGTERPLLNLIEQQWRMSQHCITDYVLSCHIICGEASWSLKCCWT